MWLDENLKVITYLSRYFGLKIHILLFLAGINIYDSWVDRFYWIIGAKGAKRTGAEPQLFSQWHDSHFWKNDLAQSNQTSASSKLNVLCFRFKESAENEVLLEERFCLTDPMALFQDQRCLMAGSDIKSSQENGQCICKTRKDHLGSDYFGPRCDIPGCVWKASDQKGDFMNSSCFGSELFSSAIGQKGRASELLASILWTVHKLVFTNLWIQVFFEANCSCLCS